MPEEDKYLMQKKELIAEVDTLLGGRAAEEVFIGEISTGAGNDLERATDIVRAMVSMYGMTDVAGLMVLEKQTNRFLGGFAQQREYSEKTQEEVDKFIKEFLAKRYEHVKETLKKYAPVIEAMVKELYEKEVIEGKRVRELIEAFENGRLEEEIKKENSENKDQNENKEDDKKQDKKEEKDENGNNS
jgi:cell division protease FtsH